MWDVYLFDWVHTIAYLRIGRGSLSTLFGPVIFETQSVTTPPPPRGRSFTFSLTFPSQNLEKNQFGPHSPQILAESGGLSVTKPVSHSEKNSTNPPPWGSDHP